ncbi:MAG: radical SAM protein [Candidatus Micrarchaeaceae archaeon]
MARYVLVADSTLIYTFRDFPLLDFLPSAPQKSVPRVIYNFLRGKPPKTYPDGQLLHAPYSIRKIEAALLQKNPREDVAVTDIFNAHRFIDDKTEVIGVSTMDPYGIGPLTMSYAALFGDPDAWVRQEWYDLIDYLNKLRAGKKAKLVVGGPGVWDFTVLNDDFAKQKIDYAVQGEIDDVANELFEQIATDSIDTKMFRRGYITFDSMFHMISVDDERYIARTSYGAYPSLEKIPTIVRPSIKSLVEIMRGCGIGCDFCEVTLRPLRYYTIDMIKKEIEVNVREGGSNKAWLHTDEFFGYKHGKFFEPNEDALIELMQAVMSIPGVKTSNPTHARISIPAGFPELIEKLSKVMHAGPNNWIGVQTGLETGSEELAKKHMPAKTLPLKIGVDGSWQEIVWKGVEVETKNYWRPAFTVQVGQEGETDDDNWETVALINKLSNSFVDNRPFEFTVTPMLNVPLGRIKARSLNREALSKSMLAVYYASYRHLAKMAARDAKYEGKGNAISRRITSGIIEFGGSIMLRVVENIAKKAGVDIEKVKEYGVGQNKMLESITEAMKS